MRNLELAEQLLEVADLLELKGDNPYRVRAYRRAAEAVQLLTEDVAELARSGRLDQVKGIGKGLAAAIREWLEEGRMSLHEQLTAEIPRSVLALLQLPGVGPKTTATLYREAGIDSLEALAEALETGRLRRLKGFGAKTEEALRRALRSQEARRGRIPLGAALPVAQQVVQGLVSHPAVERVELAGSLRRCRDMVKDIDVVAATRQPRDVVIHFAGLPGVAEVLQQGEAKTTVRLYSGIQVDLRVVEPPAFAAAWHHFTGSAAHNVRLRERAQRRALRISEYGIAQEGGQLYQPESEEELYAALGLPWIAPELREDRGEIEAAERGQLPRLVDAGDLRGDLHVHSTWSDGQVTLEAIVQYAREQGWEYVAITDHSPALRITRGLDPDRLRLQAREIEALREKYPEVRVLRGIEVDILPDGSLDLPDEVLADLDIVVASVHSRLQQDEETMTRRIVKAMENPHVDIVAHPTGRILGRRDPYPVRMQELVEAAVRTGTALEVNSSPSRLDLRDEHVREAIDAGVLLAINSDMHHPTDWSYLPLGVATARRGWATAASIINTWSADRLLDWLARKS